MSGSYLGASERRLPRTSSIAAVVSTAALLERHVRNVATTGVVAPVAFQVRVGDGRAAIGLSAVRLLPS